MALQLIVVSAKERILHAACYLRRLWDADENYPKAGPLWVLADDLELAEDVAFAAARELKAEGLLELNGSPIGPIIRATDAALALVPPTLPDGAQ